MTPPNTSDQPDRRRHLGHDTAGEAYPTATAPTTQDGRSAHPAEQVASRPTSDEARDLLALRRAKRGDTSAFAELLRANDEAVRAMLTPLVGPEQLEAVCTQVYLRAYRGLPIAPNTSPRIWLLGIADGAARDSLRRATQQGIRIEADIRIPANIPAEERLMVAAIDGAGLTPWEAARLIGGHVDQTRRLLAAGRSHPGVVLPFPTPPGHGPGFWNDLGRRLLVEQSSPAASRPRSTDIEADGVEPIVAGPRSVDVARGMALRVEQQNPYRFPWRRIGVAATVLVAVAGFVVVALSVAGKASRRDAGLGDTAAKTLDQLDASLARNTVVRGTLRVSVSTPGPLTPGVYRFERSNTGSWRLTAADGSVDDGYDVPSATAATITHSGAIGAGAATVSTGLAPGPPNQTGTTTRSPGDVLADVIRIVRSGSAGTVATRTEPVPTTTSPTDTSTGPTTTQLRPVWVVTSRLAPHAEPPILAGTGVLGDVRADEAELIADRSLALPVQLTLRRTGRTVATLRFSDLSISQQPFAASVAPTVPPGVSPTAKAVGFHAVEIGRPSASGVPTPAYLPGGYVLTAAAVDRVDNVAVVCYRNGSRQLVLTRRPMASAAGASTDPLGGVEGGRKPKRVKISSGTFAGLEGHASVEPLAHVWVDGPHIQVIAVGDPTIAQLTMVLASLR